MADIRMRQVKFGTDHQLDILLSNGHRIIYNMKPKLITARFRDISDTEIYRNGKIVGGKIIRWNENTELSLGEVVLNITN